MGEQGKQGKDGAKVRKVVEMKARMSEFCKIVHFCVCFCRETGDQQVSKEPQDLEVIRYSMFQRLMQLSLVNTIFMNISIPT